MVGRTISHYQLLDKLGAGGMGEIFKAQDTVLNRFVAIKLLSPSMAGDPERRKRFFQEAQAASALNHPNIITIYNIISDGDTQCMVMEYIAGKTLRDLIPTGGMPAEQALPFAIQMAGALNTAHGAGIIHRDLKPSNVMVTGSGLVKILDFGLAKWLAPGLGVDTTASDALTREGSIIGTMSYMSPEQAEGKRVDARTDIFSFGSVLYEMLTGRRAFEGSSGISTLTSILRDDVRPIRDLAPGVSPALENVIQRCLSKDPEERWNSMKDVEAALVAVQKEAPLPASSFAAAATVPTVAPPPSSRTPTITHKVSTISAQHTLPPPPSPRKENLPALPPLRAVIAKPPRQSSSKVLPILVGLLGLLLIAGAGIGGWLWWTNQGKPTPESSAQVIPPQAPPSASNPSTDAAPPSSQAKDQQQKGQNATSTKPTPFKKDTGATGTTAPKIWNLTPDKAADSTQQQQAAAPPPAPKKEPAATPVQIVPVTVGDAIPFRIVLTENVPFDSQEGLTLKFRAVEGLLVDGEPIIAKGATVIGSVIGEAGKKRFLGIKSSKMTFQLIQAVASDGKRINVRATAGRRKDGPAVRSFDTGKELKNQGLAAMQGSEYIAYIDGAQTVGVRK